MSLNPLFFIGGGDTTHKGMFFEYSKVEAEGRYPQRPQLEQ